MSRNFELLQNAGKEQAVFDALVAEQRQVEPVLVTEPQLKLEPLELEEITKLVQHVFVLPGGAAPRVVVFTATESGNGCSWICGRVAELLASQVTGSVCLLDANLRSPGLHQQFAVDNHHGLADALRQTDPIRSFARRLSRPNLSLISCGSTPEGSQSLLTSDRMRLRISELRSEADYVLIDAAAMNVSTDGIVLGAAADGVVMVLKANSSRREPARKAVDDLRAAKVRILGAVLNQRTFPIPESIYSKL